MAEDNPFLVDYGNEEPNPFLRDYESELGGEDNPFLRKFTPKEEALNQRLGYIEQVRANPKERAAADLLTQVEREEVDEIFSFMENSVDDDFIQETRERYANRKLKILEDARADYYRDEGAIGQIAAAASVEEGEQKGEQLRGIIEGAAQMAFPEVSQQRKGLRRIEAAFDDYYNPQIAEDRATREAMAFEGIPQEKQDRLRGDAEVLRRVLANEEQFAMVNGALRVSPKTIATMTEDQIGQALQEVDAPESAKRAMLTNFPKLKREWAQQQFEVLNELDEFNDWRRKNPETRKYTDLVEKWNQENDGWTDNLPGQVKLGLVTGYNQILQQAASVGAMGAAAVGARGLRDAWTSRAVDQVGSEITRLQQQSEALGGATAISGLAAAATSIVPPLAATLLTRGAAAPIAGAALASNIAFGTSIGVGALQSAGAVFSESVATIEENLKSLGYSDQAARTEAMKRSYLPAVAGGIATAAGTLVLGKTGTEAIAGLQSNAFKQTVGGFLKDIAVKGVAAEAVEEGADELVQGIIALYSYDPSRTMDEIVEGAMTGFVTGGILGGAVVTVSRPYENWMNNRAYETDVPKLDAIRSKSAEMQTRVSQLAQEDGRTYSATEPTERATALGAVKLDTEAVAKKQARITELTNMLKETPERQGIARNNILRELIKEEVGFTGDIAQGSMNVMLERVGEVADAQTEPNEREKIRGIAIAVSGNGTLTPPMASQLGLQLDESGVYVAGPDSLVDVSQDGIVSLNENGVEEVSDMGIPELTLLSVNAPAFQKALREGMAASIKAQIEAADSAEDALNAIDPESPAGIIGAKVVEEINASIESTVAVSLDENAEAVAGIDMNPEATPTTEPVAGWMQDSIDEAASRIPQETKDKIAELAADRKTSAEIAKELELDRDDVNAVKVSMGIPSWTTATNISGSPVEDPKFTKWRADYLASKTQPSSQTQPQTTPKSLGEKYLEAVARGDTAAAQQIVDDAVSDTQPSGRVESRRAEPLAESSKKATSESRSATTAATESAAKTKPRVIDPPKDRTVAEAIQDKDTFTYEGMRGSVTLEDGDYVFRPFGSQDKYIVPLNENQSLSDLTDEIQWTRKGQTRRIPEAPQEVRVVLEQEPEVTQEEALSEESEIEVPEALNVIESADSLNFLADLFNTGESLSVKNQKRQEKSKRGKTKEVTETVSNDVTELPEYYRQASPEIIAEAKTLIDRALALIDGMPITDYEKDILAQSFLELDQDITQYENNPEYQRYKRAQAIREVRPSLEAEPLTESSEETTSEIRSAATESAQPAAVAEPAQESSQPAPAPTALTEAETQPQAPTVAQETAPTQATVERDASKPEQMTPDEWRAGREDLKEQANEVSAGKALIENSQDWGSRGRMIEGKKAESLLKKKGFSISHFTTGLSGGAYLVRLKDGSGMYMVSPRPSRSEMGHAKNIYDALKTDSPVSTAAVDAYGITLPEGYVQQGELYVFAGATAIEPVQATPPVAGDATASAPAPSPRVDPEAMNGRELSDWLRNRGITPAKTVAARRTQVTEAQAEDVQVLPDTTKAQRAQLAKEESGEAAAAKRQRKLQPIDQYVAEFLSERDSIQIPESEAIDLYKKAQEFVRKQEAVNRVASRFADITADYIFARAKSDWDSWNKRGAKGSFSPSKSFHSGLADFGRRLNSRGLVSAEISGDTESDVTGRAMLDNMTEDTDPIDALSDEQIQAELEAKKLAKEEAERIRQSVDIEQIERNFVQQLNDTEKLAYEYLKNKSRDEIFDEPGDPTEIIEDVAERFTQLVESVSGSSIINADPQSTERKAAVAEGRSEAQVRDESEVAKGKAKGLGQVLARNKARVKQKKETGSIILFTDIPVEIAQYGQSIYKTGMRFGQWAGLMVRRFGTVAKKFLTKLWDSLTGRQYITKGRLPITGREYSSTAGRRGAAGTGDLGSTLGTDLSQFQGDPAEVTAETGLDESMKLLRPKLLPVMRQQLKRAGVEANAETMLQGIVEQGWAAQKIHEFFDEINVFPADRRERIATAIANSVDAGKEISALKAQVKLDAQTGSSANRVVVGEQEKKEIRLAGAISAAKAEAMMIAELYSSGFMSDKASERGKIDAFIKKLTTLANDVYRGNPEIRGELLNAIANVRTPAQYEAAIAKVDALFGQSLTNDIERAEAKEREKAMRDEIGAERKENRKLAKRIDGILARMDRERDRREKAKAIKRARRKIGDVRRKWSKLGDNARAMLAGIVDVYTDKPKLSARMEARLQQSALPISIYDRALGPKQAVRELINELPPVIQSRYISRLDESGSPGELESLVNAILQDVSDAAISLPDTAETNLREIAQVLRTIRDTKQLDRLTQIPITKDMSLAEINELIVDINAAFAQDKQDKGEISLAKDQTRKELKAEALAEMGNFNTMTKQFGGNVGGTRVQGGRGLSLGAKALFAVMRVEGILRQLSPTLQQALYYRIVLQGGKHKTLKLESFKNPIEEAMAEAGMPMGVADTTRYLNESFIFQNGKGQNYQLLKSEIMGMYLHTLSPDNMQMLIRNGGSIARLWGQPDSMRLIKMDPMVYDEINRILSDSDKKLMQAIFDSYNGNMKDTLFSDRFRALGFAPVEVPSYVPAPDDPRTRQSTLDEMYEINMSNDGMKRTLKGNGILIERVKQRSSAVMIEDPIQQFFRNAEIVARMDAYLEPYNDAIRLLKDRDISEEIIAKAGETGLRTITNAISAQVNTTIGKRYDILEKVMQNAATGYLGLALGAIFTNPAGISISAVQIENGEGWKYAKNAATRLGGKVMRAAFDSARLAKLAGTVEGDKKLKERLKVVEDYLTASDFKELLEVVPYARERFDNFIYETLGGMYGVRRTAYHKSPMQYGLYFMEATDALGSVFRWDMAKQYIEESRPDLKPGSREFLDAAGDYWTLMMYRSENTSHGGDKTALLDAGSQNTILKGFLAFQSAVSKQLSLAAEGLVAHRQGRNQFVWAAAGGISISVALVAMVRTLIAASQGAFGEREDEEQGLPAWLAWNIAKRFPQELVAMIPFFGPGMKSALAQLMGDTAYNGPIDIYTSGLEATGRALYATGKLGVELVNPTLNADLETERTKYAVEALRAWMNPLSLGTGIPFQGGMKLLDTGAALTGFGKSEKTIRELQKDANRPKNVTQEGRKLVVSIIAEDEDGFRKSLEQYLAKRPEADLGDIRSMITRFYGSDNALEKLAENTEGVVSQEQTAARRMERDAAMIVAEDLWQRNVIE